MKALCIRYETYGDPCEVLKPAVMDVRPPAEGELLVRIAARPINPSDLIPVRGAYAHRLRLPAVPGYEGVGVVVAVGGRVSRAWLGRRVLPLRGEGTWQQYARVPAIWAVPVPAALDDFAAAQLYINPLSAWVTCTETLGLHPGDVLVLNAAGSALGRLYAQLARLLGFRLLASVRSAVHQEELVRLGAERVVVERSEPLFPREDVGRADDRTSNLKQAVADMTGGRGAAAAVDCVGGAAAEKLAGCLRPGGTLLSLGLLSGRPVDPAAVVRAGAVLKMFHLRYWNEQATPAAWHEAFGRLIELAVGGRLKLMRPGPAFGLTDVRTAVRAAETASPNPGKTMLVG
jgi:NADPH:quinone reductase-like Zn-dependent oxidoreductase